MSSETVYTECLVKHDSRAFDHRFELPERDVARQILHPAIGRDDEPLGRNDLERGANSVGHHIRRLDSGSPRSSTPSMIVFVGNLFRIDKSSCGWAASIDT